MELLGGEATKKKEMAGQNGRTRISIAEMKEKIKSDFVQTLV